MHSWATVTLAVATYHHFASKCKTLSTPHQTPWIALRNSKQVFDSSVPRRFCACAAVNDWVWSACSVSSLVKQSHSLDERCLYANMGRTAYGCKSGGAGHPPDPSPLAEVCMLHCTYPFVFLLIIVMSSYMYFPNMLAICLPAFMWICNVCSLYVLQFWPIFSALRENVCTFLSMAISFQVDCNIPTLRSFQKSKHGVFVRMMTSALPIRFQKELRPVILPCWRQYPSYFLLHVASVGFWSTCRTKGGLRSAFDLKHN